MNSVKVDKLYKLAMVQDGVETEQDLIHAFTQLIVMECADIADKAEPYKANDLIKQHFGVEDKSIKVGSRIKVVSKFNVGDRGTVNYIEPSGKLWVRRDGASSDVSYYPEEVIGDD
jgi:hypothetical protein